MKLRVILLILCTLCPGPGLFGRLLGDGFQLPQHAAGSWGQSPAGLVADIRKALEDGGFIRAVDVAGAVADQIAAGKVPAIDDLKAVVEGDVQARIQDAVAQSTEATQLLSLVDVAAMEQLFTTLRTVLTTEQEFAFSIPGGRLVVRRNALALSLCAVVAGPNGARVTLGMSDGPQLCGNPAERFVNPTREPVLFADLALGYSHVQARRKLFAPPTPGPIPALSIQAATYFKIHDDWVQLRFAGNDPESLSITVQFVIGVRAGFSAKLQAEVEGQVILELSVQPTQTAALLLDIGDILRAELGGASPASAQAVPALAASALQKVFAHLRTVEESGEDFGEFAIRFAGDGGVGVGIWDTGINLGSVGAELRLSVPLAAAYSLQGDLLATQLTTGLETATQLVSLFEAMSEGRLTDEELRRQREQIGSTADGFVRGILSGYVDYIQDIRLGLEMGVYALGDIGQIADQTIPLVVLGADIPVGQVLVDGVNGIPRFVEGVAETAKALAWFAEMAISAGLNGAESMSLGSIITPPTHGGGHVQRPRGNPPTPPTAAEWESMAADLLDDITFSVQLGVVQLEGASLGNLVRLAGGAHAVTTSLLTGAIRSAVDFNDKPLLDALRAAPGQVQGEAAELLIFNLQTLGLSFRPSIGASGSVGAEVTVGLGGRLTFEARVKASLILLALGSDRYDEPDGTLLAGFDIPLEVSASAGVSVGEGVELSVEGGITAGQSLANLTLSDWGQALPAPAGLQVAGFEVIDFTGVHAQDGSIEGRGWIVLPMGGLVRADDFALDAAGNLLRGRWTGVVELGPLGEVSITGGPITNDGLAGQFDLPIGPSRLASNFVLRSDGLVFGRSVGRFRLGGLDIDADLTLGATGLLGVGRTRILGAEFHCTNLRIDPAGRLTGSFSGTVPVDGQLLSFQSLEILGDRLRGRTTLNVAGVNAAELLMDVDASGAVGRFVSNLNLFGAGNAEAWVRITDRIEVFGEMDRAYMDFLEGQLRGRLLGGIAGAQDVLRREREKLAGHRADIEEFDRVLAGLMVQIPREKEAARAGAEAAVTAAEGALTQANAVLDAAIDALLAASGELAAQLARANEVYRAANSALNAAQAEVNRIHGAIGALDRWYNGLDPIAKGISWLGYQATRGGMVLTLDGANKVLAGARKTNDDAYATVRSLEQQLSNPGPLLTDKTAKEQLVAGAKEELERAKQELSTLLAILADPTLDPRHIAISLARDGVVLLISGVEDIISRTIGALGDAAGLVDFIQQQGEASLVQIQRVSFNSTLSDLDTGFVEWVVDALVARQPRRFVLPFNLRTGQNDDAIAGASRMLSPTLYPGSDWGVLPWNDDASSGLGGKGALWAYHFNSAVSTTVNGVSVTGVTGVAPRVAGRFSVEGFRAAFTGDQNALTSGGGGSALLGADFLWGASPGSVTFEGLTPGQAYRATFLSVGWDNPPITRTITFGTAGGGFAVQQNQYGNNRGIRIDHTFTAAAVSHTVTLTPQTAETFHLYALALSTPVEAPLTLVDWKRGEFGGDAFNPDIGGDDEDPDGDRIPNFLEYALRKDPKARDASSFGLPEAIVLPGGVPAWRFVLPYQPNAQDVIYRIRQSGDLVTWRDVFRLDLATGTTTHLLGVSGVEDPVAGVVTVTITNAGLFAPPSFWSLRVDRP